MSLLCQKAEYRTMCGLDHTYCNAKGYQMGRKKERRATSSSPLQWLFPEKPLKRSLARCMPTLWSTHMEGFHNSKTSLALML